MKKPPDDDRPIEFEPLIPPLCKAKWIAGQNAKKPDTLFLTLTPKGKAGVMALANFVERACHWRLKLVREALFHLGRPAIARWHGLRAGESQLLHRLAVMAKLETEGLKAAAVETKPADESTARRF